VRHAKARGRRQARLLVSLVAVVLAAVGVISLTMAVHDQDPAPPPAPRAKEASSPTSSPDPPPPSGQAARTQGDPSELVYSPPVRIRIPTIDVDSSMVTVGLDSAGVMETPEPVDKAGWFEPSPPPGIPGATVIAGHVTWNQEPMVFYRLGELREGDKVEVARKDGALTVFEVTRVGSFPKKSFPTDAVYSQPDQSELRLITCGGEYDQTTNRYLDNVIVWARISSIKHVPA
jgi:LPXTG-site transpeptidase (sortase) family protein